MKKRRRYSAKRHAPTRRWHIPPPLVHGSENLEGGGILLEWEDDLAVILWHAYRDAMLWSSSDSAERGQTFSPRNNSNPEVTRELVLQREIDPRLRNGLRLLAVLVQEPTAVREEQVARACKQIS